MLVGMFAEMIAKATCQGCSADADAIF